MRKYSQDLKAASLRRKQRRETARDIKKSRGEAIRSAAKADATLKAYDRARRRAEQAEDALRAAGAIDGKELKAKAVEQLSRALAEQIQPQVAPALAPCVHRVCRSFAEGVVQLPQLDAYVEYTLRGMHMDAPVLRGIVQLNLETRVHKRMWDDIPERGTLLRYG